MLDFNLDFDYIKKFFYEKKENGAIRTTRILGITIQYVINQHYKDFAGILKYIQPQIKDNITDLIEKYSRLAKRKRISAKQYQKDYNIVSSLLDKINPKDIKPIDKVLRETQLNTLDLAKSIINDITQNTDIKLWLDGGTLLGAVRHKGFIPWDDDMDFAMLRQDYTKLIKYFEKKYKTIDTNNWSRYSFNKNIKKELKKYPNETLVVRIHTALKIIKGTENNFVILDFFAWDYYNNFHNVITIQNYCNQIKKELKTKKTYKEFFNLYDRELKKNINIVDKSDVLQTGIDNNGFLNISKKGIVRNSDIFPLKKLEFEDWEFYAPQNHHIYLKSIYNYYNKMPINGIKINQHSNVNN